MNAETTALRVLRWAAEPAGPLPAGPLWETSALAGPGDAAREAAAVLARRTAALLGAGAPPFGSAARIGPGVVLLAAAAGGHRLPGPARLLAEAVPPPRPRRDVAAWYDLVARHGLVSAVFPALAKAPATPPAAIGSGPGAEGSGPAGPEEPLGEVLLGASPLTAVLYRPRDLEARAGTRAVATAVALLGRPRGQAVLACGLAAWTPRPAVLTWRAELLWRLRPDHPGLLLDTYTVARLRHGAEWDRRVRWAGLRLASPEVPDPLALATLRFWGPLAALVRHGTSLPAVRPLLTGHQTALDLVRRHRLDQAGAA